LVRANGWSNIRFSYTELATLTARATTIGDVVGYDAQPVALQTRDGRASAVVATSAAVSGNYLATLGGAPVVGRLLTSADDASGVARAVVISEALWERQFGRSAAAIGSDIVINRAHVTVIGVVRRGFVGL